MEVHDLVHRLTERLRSPLPGEEVQYQMAPRYRVRGSFASISASEYRHSAVMALLCRRPSGQWFIPLTLRATYDGHHSDQVSLPGGRFEEADGTLANTAMRECGEEIGIKGSVSILGSLSTLHIPVSRYIVHPFVGLYHGGEAQYTTQEREVRAVIEVTLEQLLSDGSRTSANVQTGSGSVEAPCFVFDGHVVWGATAMILNELRQVLQESLQLR